jgi:basic amino acid/polyamine antiporter, APA family
VLFLLNYIATYVALFVLRRREPDLPRPYRAFGYPFTTGLVCFGCVLALVAAILEDTRSAVAAVLLLIACAPVYAWISRRRRIEGAKSLPELP